jgi:lambda-carrageenase
MKRQIKTILCIALFPLVGLAASPISNFTTNGNIVYHLAIGEIALQRVLISASYNGVIQCFDQITKEELWSYDIGEAFPFDVETGDLDNDGNDEVLVAASDGILYAIDHDGQAVLWTYQDPNSGPLYQVKFVKSNETGYVFTGGISKKIIKLNASNGNHISQLSTAGAVRLINGGSLKINDVDYVAVADAQRTLTGNFSLRVINVNDMSLLNNQVTALEYPGSQFGTQGRYYNIEVFDIDQDEIDELVLCLDHRNSIWLTVIDVENETITQKNIQDNSGKNIRTKPYAMNQIQHIKSSGLAQEYIFQLFGNDLLVKNLSGRILEELKGPYTYNACIFDSITNLYFMGSELSGGDAIYCLHLSENGWQNAFKNNTATGRMKTLEDNVNNLSAQINSFDPALFSYQPDVKSVTILPGDKTWENILNKYSPAQYEQIDFGLYILMTEDYDRSGNPDPWKTKKDHRHPYTDKAADIIAKAASYENNGQNFSVWAGHGIDPFYMQLSTLEGIMQAAPNTFKAFIFAEVEGVSNQLQTAINAHIRPLADLCLQYNKKILLRNKNIYWNGTCYHDLWWNLFKDKKYSSVFVMSMEETSDHLQELSLSGRTGLWLTGHFDMVSGRAVTDNSNWLRLWEWCYNAESLSNQIRTMSLQRMYGADFFHINIYTQNETEMIPFYKMIEKGILPKPGRDDIVSLSDLAIAMKIPPDNNYEDQGTNHHVMSSFNGTEEMKVFDKLACYWGGAPTPDHDFTRYAYNSTRRMTNFLPQSPYGNIAIVPETTNVDEFSQFKSKLLTDGRYWYNAEGAKQEADAFKPVVVDSLASAANRLPIRVYGEISWVAVRLDKSHIRLLLADPGYLSPEDRVVEVDLQGLDIGSKAWDILRNEAIPLTDNKFTITVPMGIMRIIDITTYPFADAGDDKEFGFIPDSVVFEGKAGDDFAIISQQWEQLTGPECTLLQPDSLQLIVKDLTEGEYSFQLTVYDNEGNSASDQVKLIIFCEAYPTPEVFVSPDRLVQLPKDTVILIGGATVQTGEISSYRWEKTSGPEVSISGTETTQTILSNLKEGEYTFLFTATSDAGISASAEVTIQTIAGQDSIFKTGNIEVDGDLDDSWCGPLLKLEKLVKGFINTSSKTGLLWNDTYLYAYVEMEDEYLMNDSGNEWWNDDGVEIYIDADNSKSTTYDSNDFRYGFRWHWVPEDMDMFESVHNAIEGVEWKMKEISNGYRLEVAFPWSTLKHTPEMDNEIGIEIRVLTDDDGNDNDAIIALFGHSAQSVLQPINFGTFVLGDWCNSSNNEERITFPGLRIFPTITGDGLVFVFNENGGETECIVRDISGKIVAQKSFHYNTVLSLANSSSGLYFITVLSEEHLSTVKIIKI